MVEVTQDVREMVAQIIGLFGDYHNARAVREGDRDEMSYVQIAAAHRIAATADLQAQVDELVDYLRRARGISGFSQREDLDAEAALSAVDGILVEALAEHGGAADLQAQVDELRATQTRLVDAISSIVAARDDEDFEALIAAIDAASAEAVLTKLEKHGGITP